MSDKQTYPNAGPNCDLSRYRTGEAPMVGDKVRMNQEYIGGIRFCTAPFDSTVTAIRKESVGYLLHATGHEPCYPIRFDLIRRADSPDAGKVVEPDAISEEAMGMNPDYKPPIMRWNTVEVFAPEGFSFGIITDTSGLLSLAIRPPGGDWPDEFKPMPETINTIAEGHRAYCVVNDERTAPEPTLLEAADTCFLLEDDEPSQHGKPIACTQCWNALSEMQRESASRAALLSVAANEYQALVDWIFKAGSPMPPENTTAHRIASLIRELQAKLRAKGGG